MKIKPAQVALLLALSTVAAHHAQGQALSSNSQSATPGNVVVLTGHAAIRKELEIIEVVIADSSRAVVEGKAKRDELAQLVERRDALSKLLSQAEPKNQTAKVVNSSNQSATISGCGQTLTVSLQEGSTPGGIIGMNANAYAQLDSSNSAFVQGSMYTIAKNPLYRASRFEVYRYNSAKLPSGFYPMSIYSGVSQSFIGCRKAFVNGAISSGSGSSPLSCGTVPVMLEFSGASNTNPAQFIPSCDDAF